MVYHITKYLGKTDHIDFCPGATKNVDLQHSVHLAYLVNEAFVVRISIYIYTHRHTHTSYSKQVCFSKPQH